MPTTKALARSSGDEVSFTLSLRCSIPNASDTGPAQVEKGSPRKLAPYSATAIGIALPKGSDVAEALQAAVQHLIDDGTYLKIVTKWGLQGGAVKKAPLNPTDAQQ